jgi:hypothetical protein
LASHERGMQCWLRVARIGSGAGGDGPVTSRERHDCGIEWGGGDERCSVA